MEKTRPRIPASVRKQIFEESDNRCIYCMGIAEEIDHIRPFSYTQTHNPDNMVAACKRCNLIAADLHFDTFREKILYVQNRRTELGVDIELTYDFFKDEIEKREHRPPVEKRKHRPIKRPRYEVGDTEDAKLVEKLLAKLEKKPNTDTFKKLAKFLSGYDGRKKDWSTSYLNAIYRGTLKAGARIRYVISRCIDDLENNNMSEIIESPSAQKFGSPDILRNLLRKLILNYTYAEIGQIYDVNKTIIWKVTNENYEPQSNEIRIKLGLFPIPQREFCHKCKTGFYPNVPWRKNCWICSPPRKRR